MILIINCRPDWKFWDRIPNAIDRSRSNVMSFSKRCDSDHVHGLHHHIDPAMVDESGEAMSFLFVARSMRVHPRTLRSNKSLLSLKKVFLAIIVVHQSNVHLELPCLDCMTASHKPFTL
jgi:hypothetical protein